MSTPYSQAKEALWTHLDMEHGLTLLDSEVHEIVRLSVAVRDVSPSFPWPMIPTEAGFYWWRPTKHAAWRMVKVRAVPGFPPHAADDVSENSFFGRPINGWADDFPVGEWVKVIQPNAPAQPRRGGGAE